MRDLRERLPQEGDFSHEDISGQDEPPLDSTPEDPTGKDRWMWTQKHEDECEEKPDLSVLNNQWFHVSMRALILHDQRETFTRAVCRQAFTVLVEAPEIVAARRQERRNVIGYRESSHH